MSHWDELTQTALLGTRQRGFAPPREAGALGDALARVETGDPALALLDAVALAASARRAAQRPPSAGADAPARAGPDARPLPSGPARALLARALGGEHGAVLPEWLTLAARAGVRVPEEHLPDLLERAAATGALAAAAMQAGGPRAAWLAEQNPEWAALRAHAQVPLDAIEALWETGAEPARLGALRAARRADAAAARALLARAWAGEAPQFRERALGVIGETLRADDEPLLETALDDRRAEVRDAALALLNRLPDSAHVQRMIRAAEGTLKASGLVKKSLGATPPAVFDPAWARDGIRRDAPKQAAKTSEGAFWLLQLLRQTPTRHWQRALKLDAARLADAARAGSGRDGLPGLNGALAQAALTHGELDYLGAALRELLLDDAHEAQAVAAAAALDDARYDAVVLPMLGRPDAGHEHNDPVLRALEARERPWSLALGRAFLDALRRVVARRETNYAGIWGLQRLVRRAGQFMPVALAQAAGEGWPTAEPHWGYWSNEINALSSLLQFRADMHAAFP